MEQQVRNPAKKKKKKKKKEKSPLTCSERTSESGIATIRRFGAASASGDPFMLQKIFY
jgi:hypothetical protein